MNSKPVSLISEDWNCQQQCLKSLSMRWLSRWRKIFEKENMFHNFVACACKENWHVIFRQFFVSLIVDRWNACLPIEWHHSYYECWQISTIYMIFRDVQSNYRCRARIYFVPFSLLVYDTQSLAPKLHSFFVTFLMRWFSQVWHTCKQGEEEEEEIKQWGSVQGEVFEIAWCHTVYLRSPK